MANVESTHPQYDAMKGEWLKTRALSSGSKEVKALGTEILPPAGSSYDSSGGVVYDKARYAAYLKRAIYTNFTGRTKSGLTGAAFRVDPVVDLPSGLEYLSENADGAGQSVTQLAKDTFSSLLDDGRQILLCDHPESEEGLTLEQVVKLDLKSSIKRYSALDLINWKSENTGGREILMLAVLQESYNDSSDEFGHDNKYQQRVLRLRDEGYTQQIYRDGDPHTDEYFPTKSDGSKWDFIPIFVIGSVNNDISVDPIPLGDIAHVNAGHFINSADLEENSHIHGQMTLGVTSDMSLDDWKIANPNGIAVGAMAGHFLGSTGGFHTAQASENQIADKLQERKEAQMLSLGARLVEQRNPNETAAAAKIDAAGENSVLGDLVANVEEGVRRSIECCGMFMGVDVNGSDAFTMNRQFFDEELTPEQINAQLALWQGAAISKSVLDGNLVKGGVISKDEDIEKMNDEIAQELPQSIQL